MDDKITNIPEGWKKNQIGAFIVEKPKSTIKVSDVANFGEFPFFTSGEAILYHDKKIIEGCNLFLATGGFANIKYFDGKASYSTDTYTITTNELITKYLYYYLLNSIDYINKNCFVGSGLKHLQKKDLRQHIIFFPTLSEQNKVVSILSKIDETIDQTEQLIEKYKQIKTGLMHDLLTLGIDEYGNIRSEETHKFKNSPLGRIPEDWDCITIGDIIERLRSGVTPKGGSEVYQKEGIMLIRSQNVYPYGFELEDVACISDEINKKMIGSELKEFDILLNITGASIGRSTYVPKNFPKANVNQHVCSIRLTEPNEIKSLFISSFLNSVYGQNQIIQHNAGSNRQGLNYTQIKQLYIPYYKNDYEFLNFKNCMINIETIIEQYYNFLEKLKSQKSGLMHDLLTGKVRVDIGNIQQGTISITNSKQPTKQSHNQQFEDAVLIAAIINGFYSETYLLGRKKVQKLLYLLRRHQEANTACFKKKEAGPYADEVRYKGGEPIAIRQKYVIAKTNNAGTIFSKGEHIDQALAYIEKWNMYSDMEWLRTQFKYTKVDQLELIATVDMARCDLEKNGTTVSLSTIKNLIEENKEWKAKLKKSFFDDLSIQKGIDESYRLFTKNNPI